MRWGSLFCLFAFLFPSLPSLAEPPVRNVEWSSGSEFQAQFEKERDNRYYPKVVEGRRLADGTVQYRGEFHAFPSNMDQFMVRWGMNEPSYLEVARAFEAHGFEQVSHTTFADAGGDKVHQATWLRTFRPIAMTEELKQLRAREVARWTECRQPVEFLLERKFTELDTHIRQLQKSSTSGYEGEARLSCALWAVDTTDPRVTSSLDAFVSSMPDSWTPRLLRAIHQTELGWHERGSKYAGKTSEQEFSRMRKRFALAQADLDKVLRRAPEVATAYQYRIIIANGVGGLEEAREALDAALARNPGNLAVRQAYMVALLPRWHGSLREMEHFARESTKEAASYPWLKVLDGMILVEQGDAACDERDIAKALAYYDQALKTFDHPPFHNKRGAALADLGRFEEALVELSKALSERPFLKEARARRAYIYASRGLGAEAAEEYRKLLQVYPNDPEYQTGLRWVTDHLQQTR